LEHEQPSAQATETSQVGEGVQKRIDELTAARRQAEEALKAREQALIEQSAKMAEMAMQLQQRQAAPAPVAVPEDPLVKFKDQLDPVAAQAIQAAVEATRRQMEAQFAPMIQQQAAQLAQMAVLNEASAIPNLPKEVRDRAAERAAAWKAAGLSFSPGDAITFALGEYQKGQLLKAAPVAGYAPSGIPTVTQGTIPTPPVQRSALPQNFDALPRQQQNALLEQSGLLDQPI